VSTECNISRCLLVNITIAALNFTVAIDTPCTRQADRDLYVVGDMGSLSMHDRRFPY
jgi:hypothetical protein